MRVHKIGLTPATTGLTNLFEDFFNSSFSELVNEDFVSTKPSVNVIEDADQYSIQLAAPGLNKEDFNVEVDKDQLIISAEIKEDTTEESENDSFTKREFNYSSFKRSFHLSDKVDASGIDATYNHGILTISIPKKEEAKEKEPTVIDIK
jgi:HSP20 family protein